MDKIDVKIIECLKKNARENASVIGSQVNMSVSAVIERIKKLEANGIIKQYTVVLDRKKLGLLCKSRIKYQHKRPALYSLYRKQVLFLSIKRHLWEQHYFKPLDRAPEKLIYLLRRLRVR